MFPGPAWRFRNPGQSRPTWYVNLEDPHARDAAWVLTQDHVLDLVVEPGGTVVTKDADELAAAVRAGRYTAADATRIEAGAVHARGAVERGEDPFGGRWDDWVPDRAWPLPRLPADLAGLPPLTGG